MDTSYYTLTDERHPHFPDLRRVVLDRGIIPSRVLCPSHYMPGDKGGFIESLDCLGDGGWVGPDSIVFGGSVVRDKALVEGKSEIYDGSTISQSSVVDSVVSDSIIENSTVTNAKVQLSELRDAKIYGVKEDILILISCAMEKSAFNACSGTLESTAIKNFYLMDQVDLQITNGRLDNVKHFLSIGPLGSEGRSLHVWRGAEDSVEAVLGCWSGRLKDLMDEVERRRAIVWPVHKYSKEDMDMWVREYQAALSMCLVRAESW